MRKDFKPVSAYIPEPVMIIGTYDSKGNPNAMTAAWGGISDVNEVCVCLSIEHKTVSNLLKKKCFTISSATKDTMVAADYVGMVSGNEEADKLKRVKWHDLKASKINAPIFKELPFAIECKLISYDENTGHLFGKIVNMNIDTKVLTKGKLDLNKLQPIVFDGVNNNYHVVGEKCGNTYEEFNKIIQK